MHFKNNDLSYNTVGMQFSVLNLSCCLLSFKNDAMLHGYVTQGKILTFSLCNGQNVNMF